MAARPATRQEQGLSLLEGVRLVAAALAARIAMPYFLYTLDLAQQERGGALVAALQAHGVRGIKATPAVLAAAADTASPQGIVAPFRIPTWRLGDLGAGPVLVTENLQDPGNLGTLVRAGHALGAAGLLAVGGVDPWAPKVVRAAMGSLFALPVLRSHDLAGLLQDLTARGYRILVADAAAGETAWVADLAGQVALVIGSEAQGPSASARALSTGQVQIPMPGGAESLNAGIAGSLLLYEALRQRQQRPQRL